MNASLTNSGDAPRVRGARRWLVAYPRAIPIAIFLAIAVATGMSVFAIESNARAAEKARVSESAQAIAAALDRRGTSFSSYLRAGAALFSSLDEVSPEVFEDFVSKFEIETHYHGSEGIGWVTELEPDEVANFLASTPSASIGLSQIRPEPASKVQRVAPITYLYPDSQRNRRALGFDMYSEPIRAVAMDQAQRTGSPTASGKVVLAQEGEGDSPGFVIFMPVYKGDGDNRRHIGYVYSPFHAAKFLEAAIETAEAQKLGVRLYDGAAETGNLLVARSIDNARSDRLEQPVRIANRDLLLVIESPDALALAPMSMLALLFGIATASLLMLLARLLTQQAFEDQKRLEFFEEQHSIRNSLSRELNHRVKNTLANVLSILSLTRRRTDDLDEFADSLEGRIRALSATHDLLTHSDWGTISMADVINAELQHFSASKDHPITLDGPAVELAPNDALSFGLAIHELATNAAKFGSLSIPDGAVSVRWELTEPTLAMVEWCESGGPVVADMRPRGFGTELIQKIVAHELKHPVELDFERAGVRCVMRVPVRRAGDFRIREA